MKRAIKITSISAYVVIVLAMLSGCYGRTKNNPQSDSASFISSVTIQQKNTSDSVEKQKNDLVGIYSQAIGDYIRLVNKEYKRTFDTLFFGRHVYGQPDDFPNIELPAVIKNTHIKLIEPEQGKLKQEERKLSFYINLIGGIDNEKADFIFVAFSNGIEHQFDCFISYIYNTKEKRFDIENFRFENFLYKAK